MSTKKKEDVTNLKVETFRLNRDNDSDKELIEFLEKSNNKTGLVKDALKMYKTLVESGAYHSPFIKGSETNWDVIFATLDPSRIITGRRPEVVKEEIKQELRERAQQQYQAPAEEPVEESIDYENYEGNEDNDIDI